MVKMVENPFLSIIPRKDEKLIGIKEDVDEIIKKLSDFEKGKILFISGEYGSGKSLVVRELEKRLEGKFEKFKFLTNTELIHNLRNIPTEKSIEKEILVFIDRMDLLDVMKETDIKKILELISELSRMGVSFVISVTPKVLDMIFKNSDLKEKSIVYEMKPFTLEQTKEFILNRLNEARIEKSNDLSPFSEKEVEMIWKKSKGNPRMILLLCATLYDAKMQK